MQIINIANNQRLKKGDVFYLNFNNLFLLTLEYFNSDTTKNINILNFEILIDYNIFLNIYKENSLSVGVFGALNTLRLNEVYYCIKNKEKFEKSILKDFRKTNYKIEDILNYYTSVNLQQNKQNNNSNLFNNCYKKLQAFNSLYKSNYKIDGVYTFRANNIIIFCSNLDKIKNNVLNNINNYKNVDLAQKILTTQITGYNYVNHFNCCGLSYLNFNSFSYSLPEDLKLLCDNYFRYSSMEDYITIENKFIEYLSDEIIKVFFPLMCKSNKSILLNLYGFFSYFNVRTNSGRYYELESEITKMEFKEKIIKNLNSIFKSTIIDNNKILIEV